MTWQATRSGEVCEHPTVHSLFMTTTDSGQHSRAPLPCGKAEGIGMVQPREEKIQGRLPVPQGSLQERWRWISYKRL